MPAPGTQGKLRACAGTSTPEDERDDPRPGRLGGRPAQYLPELLRGHAGIRRRAREGGPLISTSGFDFLADIGGHFEHFDRRAGESKSHFVVQSSFSHQWNHPATGMNTPEGRREGA